MIAPLKVFFSYAHEDEAHRESLNKHLSALVREGVVVIWHDRQITGGREWAGDIHLALKDAEIVLLLISPDFLASDYCNDVELDEAIRMHDAKQARVVPVILRSCDWERSRFASLNALPPDGKPIVEAAHPDERFKAVAKGLRAIVSELRAVPHPCGEQNSSRPPIAESIPNKVNADPAARKSRNIIVGKITLFGGILEIGPFKIPLSHSFRTLLISTLLVCGVGLGVTYWLVVHEPISQARKALRIARYDIALDSLSRIPEWLGRLPNVKAIRVKSQFGVAFHKPEKDWERLGIELRNQRAAAPSDPDLLVLEAKYWLHRDDRDKARDLVAAALQQDNQNAEAWFMRGLDRYRSLEVSDAAIDLRRAADLAPDSPQYRSGLARTLLEMGKIDESIEEYRKVNQFPLARAEQALAHWAKGEIAEAVGAQRDATKMLRDARLGNNSYNLRMWIFHLPKKWVRLITPEDKLCYVLVGAAASNWLARPNENTFPPNECSDPSSEIRELVANDLCRFVDSRRPDMAAVTEKLRGMLAQPKLCSS